MSGDPSQALAAAAARISELQAQLGQAQADLARAQADRDAAIAAGEKCAQQVATLQSQMATAADAASRALADQAALTQEAEQRATKAESDYTTLAAKFEVYVPPPPPQSEFDKLTAQKNAAVTSRDALAAKFDALYGPVEPGIRRGPAPYLTPDEISHPTLHAARMHLLGNTAGVSSQQAHSLVQNADVVIPLIQRSAGGAP